MKADIAGGTYVDNAYVRPIHIRGLLEPLCSRYHHLKLKIPEELQQIHCDADALYHVLHNAGQSHCSCEHYSNARVPLL